MRMEGHTREQIELAADRAAILDRRMKRVLHRYLSELPKSERSELKAALGQALETTTGTISRQASPRDLPFQCRLKAAASVLAPDLFHQLLAVEHAVVGEMQDRGGDETEALRELARKCHALTGESLEILEDHVIDQEEELRLRKLLSEIDEYKQVLLSRLENRSAKVSKLRGVG